MSTECLSCGRVLELEMFVSDICVPCLLDDIETKNAEIEKLERQLEEVKKFITQFVAGLQKTASLE